MAVNTDEEHLENSAPIQSENPPEAIIPNTDTEPINPNQAIENMEVHHHAHDPAAPHHKKNWKSYFWEFLMLFLAVFCGFLAEYQLEHKIENDRAKELAKSLYLELYEDSIKLDNVIKMRNLKEDAAKYLMTYFEKADFNLEADSAFRCLSYAYLAVSSTVIFEPSEGILNQLQNSGSRRYFKSQPLQNAISKLSSSIQFLRLRNDRELTFMTNSLRPFCLKHLDYKWVGAFTQEGKSNIPKSFASNFKVEGIKPFLKKPNLIDRDDAINLSGNLLLMLRGLKGSALSEYKEYSKNVMNQLRQEYKLD